MTKRRSQEEVELNVASMLDMAFQLLTFFILTFRASPLEGQISVHMPPPQQVFGMQNSGERAGEDPNKDPNKVEPVKTLLISVADQDGEIPPGGIRLGIPGQTNKEMETLDFPQLQEKLGSYFRDSAGAFEQVIIEGSPGLYYRELMRVVEVCSKVQIESGSEKKLARLSFVSAVKEKDD
jgi:biopolymer transport protein ExbD